jgi:hypothetical protein
MEENMKASGRITKCTAEGFLLGKMEENMKESITKTSNYNFSFLNLKKVRLR